MDELDHDPAPWVVGSPCQKRPGWLLEHPPSLPGCVHLAYKPQGQSLKSQSGRQDSNLRPSAPKAPALPSCATPRLYHLSPRPDDSRCSDRKPGPGRGLRMGLVHRLDWPRGLKDGPWWRLHFSRFPAAAGAGLEKQPAEQRWQDIVRLSNTNRCQAEVALREWPQERYFLIILRATIGTDDISNTTKASQPLRALVPISKSTAPSRA